MTTDGRNHTRALLKRIVELRDSCIDCVCKHLSQALVLMQEVHQGYPKHHWIAVGHLGEAADEAVKEFPELAATIREHRIKYMADPSYSVPVLDLIEKAQKHMKTESKKAQSYISKKISKLDDEHPDWKHSRKVAAAHSMARDKGYDVPEESLARSPLLGLGEDSPPGWHGTVRAMKTHGHTGKGKDKIDNPYALAWWMKNQGDEPHYKDQKTSLKGKPKKKPEFKDDKEETVSIFDALVEGDLPDAFKKNVGKWKIKGGENPDAKKKGADYEGPSDDDDDDKPSFLKRDDDDSEMDETSSIFDAIVQENNGSLFDFVEEQQGGSLFDNLVEQTEQTERKPAAKASWDDRMARTLTLADELVSLRDANRK